MLAPFLFFFIISLSFFSNYNFLFLSEELLVFLGSISFVFLMVFSFRATLALYFFLAAYHLYVSFIYMLIMYKELTANISYSLLAFYSNVLFTNFKFKLNTLFFLFSSLYKGDFSSLLLANKETFSFPHYSLLLQSFSPSFLKNLKSYVLYF